MKVEYVSRSRMIDETGMDALGYTQPHKERILIQKGLDKDTEHEVRKHEWDHAKKGEEGPFWGPILGGLIGALGARSAADAQAQSTQSALDFERQRYNEMAPFRTSQINAVQNLNQLMSGEIDPQQLLERDPGYQFRTQQGQQGFNRMLQARGGRLGGRAIKEAMRYNQGQGSQEYGNLLNRYFRLAGLSTPQNPSGQITPLLQQQGANQANYAANLNQVAQDTLGNYQTYRTYQDWNKPSYRAQPGTTDAGLS